MRAVITFHSIDARRGPLSYPPRDLAALLATLVATRVPLLDLDTLLSPATTRGVTLTFDDGMRSVLDAALPVLREHRAPAHLFLATGLIEPTAAARSGCEMLTWDGVVQLARAGVAIEGHTHGHPDLRRLADEDVDAQCERADALIEQRIGRRPRYFAYPFGHHDARVAGRIAARYAAAFTTRLGFLSADAVASRLPRIDAHYLRGAHARRPLASPATRAWLAARKVLRRVRGSE